MLCVGSSKSSIRSEKIRLILGMIEIIAGTDRPDARSLEVAKIIADQLKSKNVNHNLISLRDVPLNQLDGSQYSQNQPEPIAELNSRILSSRGIIIVTPEYNGSMPGALKYFIDHWKFPEAYYHRPICLVGLGGRFGGIRPIEHLAQIMSYRAAFVYPGSVSLTNIWSILKDGKLTDETASELLTKHIDEFVDFIDAIESKKMDANSILLESNP
jgi:chromate reductase